MAPNRLICWDAWSPVGSTVWEGLGCVALVEGSVSLGQALRFLKPTPIPVNPLCLVLVDGDMSSWLQLQCLFINCHVPHHDGRELTLWNCESQINSFFLKLPWSWCLITTIQNYLRPLWSMGWWGRSFAWPVGTEVPLRTPVEFQENRNLLVSRTSSFPQ